MMLDPAIPVKIFVSYARPDEALREELDLHLAVLRRQEAVSIWHDRGIEPGEEWDRAIRDELAAADIILLLVSPSFLASDYIHRVELREALDRHGRGEAVVIPVILKPCVWELAEFARLQGLPRNARPITAWPDRDEAFYDVVQGVQGAILRVQRRKREGV